MCFGVWYKYFSTMIKKRQEKLHKEGFSVIEFIVVMSIFAIMSSVTLFDYNRYRNNVEETNLAQSVALLVRQAQLYGISASNRDIGGVFEDEEDEVNLLTTTIRDITQNSSIRGIAINVEENRFTLFEDIDSDRRYDSSVDRIIDVAEPTSRSVFMKACLETVDSFSDFSGCTEVIENDDVDIIHVTFKRPYPDAYLAYDTADNYNTIVLGFFTDASQIEPSSYVKIDASGNISVVK